MDTERIKQLIASGHYDEALGLCDNAIKGSNGSPKVTAHALYLRGNAWLKKGNTRQALNNYLQSIELDPDGPAAIAYKHIQEILNFYDHDLYNP